MDKLICFNSFILIKKKKKEVLSGTDACEERGPCGTHPNFAAFCQIRSGSRGVTIEPLMRIYIIFLALYIEQCVHLTCFSYLVPLSISSYY